MAKKADSAKDPAAVSLGRRGGSNSRRYMTREQASELGRRAVRARWARAKKKAAKQPKAARSTEATARKEQ